MNATPHRSAPLFGQYDRRERGFAPGVAESLERLYPGDQAIGFAEGERRGWFWVEVPVDTVEE